MAKFITLTDGQNRITVNIDFIICYEADNGRGSKVYINGYPERWLSAGESPNDIKEKIRVASLNEE